MNIDCLFVCLFALFLPESWRAMSGDVFVSLLETIVLAHIVQVVTTKDDRAGHFVLDDDARQNAASDRHVAGERTLLVDVGAVERLARRLEA